MKNIFIDRDDIQVPTVGHMSGGDQTYGWSFGREATRRGTTIQSVNWDVDGDAVINSATLNPEGVSTASVYMYGNQDAVLNTQCTFANGDIRTKAIRLQSVAAFNINNGYF